MELWGGLIPIPGSLGVQVGLTSSMGHPRAEDSQRIHPRQAGAEGLCPLGGWCPLCPSLPGALGSPIKSDLCTEPGFCHRLFHDPKHPTRTGIRPGPSEPSKHPRFCVKPFSKRPRVRSSSWVELFFPLPRSELINSFIWRLEN